MYRQVPAQCPASLEPASRPLAEVLRTPRALGFEMRFDPQIQLDGIESFATPRD